MARPSVARGAPVTLYQSKADFPRLCLRAAGSPVYFMPSRFRRRRMSASSMPATGRTRRDSIQAMSSDRRTVRERCAPYMSSCPLRRASRSVRIEHLAIAIASRSVSMSSGLASASARRAAILASCAAMATSSCSRARFMFFASRIRRPLCRQCKCERLGVTAHGLIPA